MVWQGKRRKQLPSNWGAIRKRVLVRDGYRCTSAMEIGRAGDLRSWAPCPNRANEVHHINGPTDHRLESLRSICAYHAEAQADVG